METGRYLVKNKFPGVVSPVWRFQGNIFINKLTFDLP